MRSFIPTFALLSLIQSPAVVHGKCSKATNCADCMSAKPQYASMCTWWQDEYSGGYCDEGCGMNGCGATVCPSDLTTCADCLGGEGTAASGQYAWSPSSGHTGECVASCMDAPADAACFKSKSHLDPGKGYDSSICPSISVCRTKEGCGDCLKHSTCAWSEDKCYDSCQDYDVARDTPCYEGKYYSPSNVCSMCASIGNNCQKCMKKGCAWSVGECMDDCRYAPADAPCFQKPNYGKEICSREFTDEDSAVAA